MLHSSCGIIVVHLTMKVDLLIEAPECSMAYVATPNTTQQRLELWPPKSIFRGLDQISTHCT